MYRTTQEAIDAVEAKISEYSKEGNKTYKLASLVLESLLSLHEDQVYNLIEIGQVDEWGEPYPLTLLNIVDDVLEAVDDIAGCDDTTYICDLLHKIWGLFLYYEELIYNLDLPGTGTPEDVEKLLNTL